MSSSGGPAGTRRHPTNDNTCVKRMERKEPMRPNAPSNKRTVAREPVLLAVTPPRSGERTLLGVENLLASIAVPEPFSLELAGDANGVTLMARCQDGQVVRSQLSAHYPQARIHEVAPEHDPLRLEEGEQAWTMTLRADGPEYVPLRTFRDADLTEPGSDPLIALIGALAGLRDGERIVATLLLRSLGPGWAEHHQRLVHERPAPGAAQPPQAGTPQAAGGLGMAVLGIGAFIALKAYQWIQADETWKAVLLGFGVTAGLIAAGWVKARFFKRPPVYDPMLIREKVSRIAFDAEVQVTPCCPWTRSRAGDEILSRWPLPYRPNDNPAGAAQGGRVLPPPRSGMLHPQAQASSQARPGSPRARRLCTRPGAGRTPLVTLRRRTPARRPGDGGGAQCGEATAGRSERSASPTTCSAATTSMSRAPAWASPPSCTIWSPTSSQRRRQDATPMPSSS